MRSGKWLTGALIFVGLMLMLHLVVPNLTDRMVEPAWGQNRATAGGDYVVASGRTSSSVQVMYVVDTRLKKMVVYGSRRGGRTDLTLLDGRNLEEDFPGGCSGQVLLQPFDVSDSVSAVSVLDVVNKKMVVFMSRNYGKLEVVGVADLGKDFGS